MDLEILRRYARRDDLFNHIVPSDVRVLIREVERLQALNTRIMRSLHNMVEDGDATDRAQARELLLRN